MQEIKELLNNCESCVTKPCQVGCPLLNDTTGFMKLMKEEKYKEAYELLCQTTVLSPICGRICPHTKQCQGNCVKRVSFEAVQIGKLEAFIGDLAIKNNWDIPKFTDEKNGKKVTIIGGGPAGLTCAAFLARNGFEVTIYEKHKSLGGVIEHGIPEFRLEREILENTINKILNLGINVEYNKELGKDFSLDELESKYDAIFLSFGKNISSKMGIEGEEIAGVFGGNELLEYKTYPDFKGKKVAVIGGGNVAMDTCRTVKRLGAKTVTVIYRRSEEEMPAEKIEIEDAKKDGVDFLFQTNILKIMGEDKVKQIECIKTELIQKPGETRKVPVNIENSNYTLDMDYVIMAVGSQTDNNLVNSLDIELTRKGTIAVDSNYKTSREKVFAGGDLAGAKGTVAWAARTGRDAAEEIQEYLLKGGEN